MTQRNEGTAGQHPLGFSYTSDGTIKSVLGAKGTQAGADVLMLAPGSRS